MTISRLLAPVEEDLKRVEDFILFNLNTEIPLLNEVGQYILKSGGKRLRPALLMISARMFQFPGEGAHQAAGAIEYLHTATLLHDDVVDDADVRRSRRAARTIWGNSASVLVGDYLLATAFRSLTQLGDLTVLNIISHTTSMMAKGEILQLIRRFDTATEADYLDIIIHKTACLFAAAAQIGGILAGAEPEQQEALYKFGHELGIAFQIVDDALDYAQDRDRVGKPLGVDLKERKVTLPLSRLMSVTKGAEQTKLKAILAKEAIEDDDVLAVVEMMAGHGVLAHTLDEASRYVELSKSHLAMLPDLPERRTLEGLADYVVERDF